MSGRDARSRRGRREDSPASHFNLRFRQKRQASPRFRTLLGVNDDDVDVEGIVWVPPVTTGAGIVDDEVG